ncbi:tRNA lysidine(34) synthetase TilS [Stutzerimonas degradans]|uniref:tRNA(Ile)-lysidine synthase n=1 Tax=Stutzerimonas degradans TaxID=2968968 RepID=A0A8E2U0I9_9GAMM|nr:tRNA lysidine(34) synthetase TilS [Stutzerimonas degradans]MCQ4277207.1 tRNA lysidine(34) synthetase TilS [Stutzerimonas degradans]PNF75400.1 tRNA lysidine(34) synthetase TilS [Stutzerimonas degradans]QPT22273.1 tRNA lysidine(34) synthetase TilS [Stutzerimonas degradans]
MSLEARLSSALSCVRHAPRWCVAFSGGLDSTVLLQLLVDLARREALPPLRAIHVHHGLQSAADAWPEHCRRVCTALGVPLEVVRVQVEAGSSLEQAARQARYAAIELRLEDGEVLLTAQHRDDQAETLLFRLLRGAGVRGLAAMPARRRLGRGWLVRPLLDVSRGELEAHARRLGLTWVEDPSNDSLEFSRNYLRHQVMPVLAQRWPQTATTLARTAAHMAEAQALLDELAEMDVAMMASPGAYAWLPVPSLALAPMLSLSPARQRNALRHWLAPFTALPDSEHWKGWESLCAAAADSTPVWRLAAGELHRCGDRLWWLSGRWLRPVVGPVAWNDPNQALQLPDNGSVQIAGAAAPARYEVRYRQGGEVLQVPGRGSRDLKRLLNEAGVPRFARARLPLLYADGQLVGVANLPGLCALPLTIDWQPPPADAGLS